MIKSVNFHLWEPCNMRCGFCFATFQDVKESILPKGHLHKHEAIKIVEEIAKFGFEKITFAGGEPTLCNWLSELITMAKRSGMTTMIVTNGSNLSDKFLAENERVLDWVTLSIDSLIPVTNQNSGRAIAGKRTLKSEYYHNLVQKIKQMNFGLKINTVVHRLNLEENLAEFIKFACPSRWKIFQVLPIVGQNDAQINKFKISSQQFDSFVGRHSRLHLPTKIIPETNYQMKGSYAMIDPAGRFFDNSEGKHQYSDPILSVGVKNALKQVNYSLNKFMERGGVYEWNRSI